MKRPCKMHRSFSWWWHVRVRCSRPHATTEASFLRLSAVAAHHRLSPRVNVSRGHPGSRRSEILPHLANARGGEKASGTWPRDAHDDKSLMESKVRLNTLFSFELLRSPSMKLIKRCYADHVPHVSLRIWSTPARFHHVYSCTYVSRSPRRVYD